MISSTNCSNNRLALLVAWLLVTAVQLLAAAAPAFAAPAKLVVAPAQLFSSPAHLFSSPAQLFAAPAPAALPALPGREPRVVVLPVENLTAGKAPLEQIRRSLARRLRAAGGQVVDEAALAACMYRHRIRYVGGVDTATARIFKEELGADAVLVTSLEAYVQMTYPQVSVTARLVTTEETPQIVWMDSAALAGDDHPGVLGLGLITDPHLLQEKALRQLVKSLRGALTGGKAASATSWADRYFRPKFAFREGGGAVNGLTVAVLPFANRSKRKNANVMAAVQFVRQLARVPGVHVLEPGVVRERMLKVRTVLKDGMTYRDMDTIAGEMRIDLFVSGKVFGYQDSTRPESGAELDFTAMVIRHQDRKVLWASSSYNSGADPVFVFDYKMVRSASALAAKMIQAVVAGIAGGS